MIAWHPPVLFEERLRPSGRAWWWLPVITLIAFFVIGLVAAPLAVLAWFINVMRYRRTVVRIDTDRIAVGRRSVRLTALDLDSVGRATNPWLWRYFSSRYLGGNPVWTRDSVKVKGREGKRKCWVSVGTNRRDELLETLRHAADEARERARRASEQYRGLELPPPGWYDDPWDASRVRWWDGDQWTGYAATRSPFGVER